jgi:multidrug resistance efflux pump
MIARRLPPLRKPAFTQPLVTANRPASYAQANAVSRETYDDALRRCQQLEDELTANETERIRLQSLLDLYEHDLRAALLPAELKQ